MKITALQLKQNPLFRVLAFLDNTDVQEFVLEAEVNAKGEFVRPTALFDKHATAIGTILRHSVSAFRENVERVFENEEEKKAVLSVLTAKVSTPTPPDTPRGLAVLQQEAPPPAEVPAAMPWEEKICQPSSFAEFVNLIESGFPLFINVRLLEVLQIDLAQCGSPFPLTEQFLIDGVDRWFSALAPAEADRITMSCGVQPSVLEALKATSATSTLEPVLNFLVDIIFPTADMLNGGESCEQVMDWLLESYMRNRETVDVEAEPSADDEEAEAEAEAEEPERKKVKTHEDKGLEGWTPSKDEVVLTAENIDYFMKEKPSLVPRSIMVERRRSWMDATITEEELQHHYTAKELKKIVEEMAAQEGNPPPVSEAVRQKALRAKKKDQCIQVILQMHKEEMQDVNVTE